MKFNNDGAGYSTPEVFSTSKTWTLNSTEGVRTVYVQFGNGAGVFSGGYTDTINLDTAAPTGTISVNAGAAYTTGVTITVTNSMADAGTSVVSMRFSNDGSTWTTWEGYTGTKTFTLAAGDGAKTVSANFKDQGGFITGNITDGITLDALGPTGTVSVNSGGATTTTTSVTLALSAADTGSSPSSMRFNNDGGAWGAWAAYAATAAWTLGSGNGTRVVYAAFNDANGNVSSTTITDAITLDNSGPTGTITINGGAVSSAVTGVTLGLTYADATGTVVSMRFSDDGSSWSAIEAVNASKLWTLPGGDGTKTVYVRYCDGAGNWGSSYSDTINLVSGAPTGTILINGSATRTNTNAVTLSLSATAAGSTVVSMRFANDGGAFGAAETYSTSKAWSLSAASGTRTVTVQYKNDLGTWSSNISDSIILCLVSHFNISMPAKVLSGTALTVTATAMQNASITATLFTNIGSFETTDTSVLSIPDQTFVAGTAGVVITLNSSGVQTVGVYDKGIPLVYGSGTIKVFKNTPVGTSGATITDAGGVKIEIPTGALNVTINVGVGAESLPLDPIAGHKYRYTKNPVYRDFGELNLSTLTLAGITFNKKIKITIPYDSADIGNDIAESTLRIFCYNPIKRDYELVDGVQNVLPGKISCSVDHFSMYRILGAYIAADLSGVQGYPSPYNPLGGFDGKFKLINMPKDTSVTIYNIAGEKVIDLAEIDMPASNSGWIEWNGKNSVGEIVARGVYIYVMTTPDGKKKTGKIALVK